MAEDLHQSFLHPVVVGALRDAINQHGPIDRNLIGSAAKRVIGAVQAALKENSGEPAQNG